MTIRHTVLSALLTSAAVTLAVCSCGGGDVVTHRGGKVLERIGEDDVASMKRVAPEAFEKVARYNAMAEEMGRSGNAELEERYVLLAEYQLRLARALVEKHRLEAKLQNTASERKRVADETANVTLALDSLNREAERREIRAHLTAVVDETRLRAAAEEEKRERFLTGEQRRAIGSARKRVAEEMIARARLWLDTLPFVLSNATDTAAPLGPVQEAIAATEADVDKDDLTLIQENIERAGAAGRALMAAAWDGASISRAERLRQIGDALSAAGYTPIVDAFGIALSLADAAERSDAAMARFATLLNRMKSIGIVVLATVAKEKGAAERSGSLAETSAMKLIEAGFPKNAVRYRGVGTRVPLKSLREGEDRVAFLLVPVPVP